MALSEAEELELLELENENAAKAAQSGVQWEEQAVHAESPLNMAATVGQGLEDAAGFVAEQGGKFGERLNQSGHPIAGAVVKTAGVIPAAGISLGGDMVGHTPGEVALNLLTMGGASAIKAGAKGLGQGAAAVGNKLAPEMMEAIQAAANMGIDLTPAELTGKNIHAAVEALLARTPFSSGIMQRFMDARMTKLNAAKVALLDRFGAKKEVESMGEAAVAKAQGMLDAAATKRATATASAEGKIISGRKALLDKTGEAAQRTELGLRMQAGAMKRMEAEKAKATKLYQAVRDEIPPELDLTPADNLRETARKLLETKGAAPSTLGAREREALQGIVDAPQGLTWDKLHELQSAYGDDAFSLSQSDRKAAAIYVRLKQAARDDMKAMAERLGGRAQEKYEAATAFYKTFRTVHDNKTLRQFLAKKPEEAFDMIVKKGGVTDIRRLKEAIGEPAFNRTMRRTFMEKMVGAVDGEIPKAEDIMARMADFDKETLKEVLSPTQITQLEKFAKSATVPQFVESEIEGRLRKMVAKDPSAVARSVMTGDPTTARLVKKIVGAKGWEPYRRQMLEKIIGESGEDVFSSNKISNALKSIPPEKRRLFFSDAEVKEIEQMAGVKRLTETVEKKWGNPSGTARNLITGGQGALLITNPITGIKTAVSAAVAAKLYTTTEGRRLLSQGLNANERNAAAVFTRLIGAANAAKKGLGQEQAGQ